MAEYIRIKSRLKSHSIHFSLALHFLSPKSDGFIPQQYQSDVFAAATEKRKMILFNLFILKIVCIFQLPKK